MEPAYFVTERMALRAITCFLRIMCMCILISMIGRGVYPARKPSIDLTSLHQAGIITASLQLGFSVSWLHLVDASFTVTPFAERQG
jgi:hypothetical protein